MESVISGSATSAANARPAGSNSAIASAASIVFIVIRSMLQV
jgi:hypothetical protein